MAWICGENDVYVRTDAITAFEIQEWPVDAWTVVAHYGDRREANLKTLRESAGCTKADAERLVHNVIKWLDYCGAFDFVSFKDYDPIKAREQ